jgi:GcrA cell cycle regulator
MTAAMCDRWDSGDDSRLTRLWLEGLTTRAIATELETTRNAIIGRARRLGLPKRPSPIKPNDGKADPRTYKKRNAAHLSIGKRAALYGPKVEPATVFVMPPARTCQWIEGDASKPRFCDAPTAGMSSWCPEHRAVCIRKVAA